MRTLAVSPGSIPGTKTAMPSARHTPSKSAPRPSAVKVSKSFFFIRFVPFLC